MYNEIADRVSLDQLDLICEALGCDLSDILVREANDEPRISVPIDDAKRHKK